MRPSLGQGRARRAPRSPGIGRCAAATAHAETCAMNERATTHQGEPAPTNTSSGSSTTPPRSIAAAWAALLAEQPSATPFASLPYLRALHESESAVAATGWAPHFLALEQDGELVAACPLYLKDHSYGEYVFDWAWADAYQRHGLDYYPKLVDAIPFTPVPGPRLLARTHEHRAAPAARHRAAGALGRALVGAPALPRRRRPGRRARRRLVDAQHGPVPLEQPRARALRRLRRLPRQPAAREAQEDPAGAAPRRRRRRHLRRRQRRRDRPRPTGTSSTAATPSPTAPTTRRPT